jgi:hypothetical protein
LMDAQVSLRSCCVKRMSALTVFLLLGNKYSVLVFRTSPGELNDHRL